jgi:hypothetical protein
LKPERHLYLPRGFRRQDSSKRRRLIREGIRQIEIRPIHRVEALDLAH